MSLPPSDVEFLTERGLAHEVAVESGQTCVMLRGWTLPEGFDQAEVDLLLRLSPGYPDVQPDMWWFSPAVRLASASRC